MGQHRVSKNDGGQPNGDEAKLSSHLVILVDLPTPYQAVGGVDQSGEIEAAYDALAQRARDEASVIVSAVQTINLYQVLNPETNLFQSRMLVTITAQRMTLAEIQRQRLMGGR
jgi:hypothetical protein